MTTGKDESQAESLRTAFRMHPRKWRDFAYVYPVISRRAKGLSIVVNLNPDTACNFNCVYCCVDRTLPPQIRKVDLAVLREELRHLVKYREALFAEPEFCGVPEEYRRLNDIAFSGDGEPTASPMFPEAARLAAQTREEFGLRDAKIVIITDACFLTRPKVVETLAFLDAHHGETWAKLDAGTEDYFRRITRPSHTLQHVLDNILATARVRPVVIQSLFMRLHGAPPTDDEIEAYVGRLRELSDAGAQIRLVQTYTVARRTAEPYVAPLEAEELERIADRVRQAGLAVESYA